MRRCEDEKMFHRPPLLEEPCAQTLSGKNVENQSVQSHCSRPRNPVTEPAIDDPMKEELLEVMPPPKPV